MADAAQQSALPGVDPNASYAPGEPAFGDSTVIPKGGSALPQSSDSFLKAAGIDPAAEARATSSIASAARDKLGQQTSLDKVNNARLEEDRQRMSEAYGLEAASAHDPALKPWNADQERADRVRGPLEQFGSVGTIFALAASAFTKQPMVSALNAGAAAMTAIKQSDEAGYKSAYEAWKQNTDLALKRFDMERALYADADKMATTDIAAWKQKTQLIAAQFDDKKMLAMLENGMDKDIWDVRAAKTKAYEGLVSARERTEEFNFKHETYKEGYEGAVEKYKAEHDGKAPDKITDFQMRLSAYQKSIQATKPSLSRSLNPDQEFAQRWWEEHPQGSSEEFGAAFDTFKRGQKAPTSGAGSTGTRAGSINEDRTKMDAAIRQEHPDWSDDKVIEERNKRLKNSSTSLTGNEKVKLEDRVNKFAHSDEIIDKTLKVLETRPAAAGIAGKAMRLEERVSNILGTKSTERVQMMRDIELLRGWAKELLFSSNSKLKKEAERVDAIVGGTSAGDTGPNTIRALRDLKNMYDSMRAEDEAKLGGTWKPPVAGESKPAPTTGKTPWSKDPITSP